MRFYNIPSDCFDPQKVPKNPKSYWSLTLRLGKVTSTNLTQPSESLGDEIGHRRSVTNGEDDSQGKQSL